MTPEEFMNQPTEFFVPTGYMACTTCWHYLHHPLIHCHKCGSKIMRVKSMPFMEFIQRTSKSGSGPMNTLSMVLRRVIDKRDLTTVAGWSGSLSPKAKVILNYAKDHIRS